MYTIGERLRAARKQQGLTQTELAAVLHCRQNLICQWENGRRNPKQSSLERLAAALDVPLSELLAGDDIDPVPGTVDIPPSTLQSIAERSHSINLAQLLPILDALGYELKIVPKSNNLEG